MTFQLHCFRLNLFCNNRLYTCSDKARLYITHDNRTPVRLDSTYCTKTFHLASLVFSLLNNAFISCLSSSLGSIGRNFSIPSSVPNIFCSLTHISMKMGSIMSRARLQRVANIYYHLHQRFLFRISS